MSAGAIFQEALRTLNRLRLPEAAQRDAVAALDAGRSGPLTMFYIMGMDAELAPEPLLARASALFLGFCCGNLTDDLVDGDCTYLASPSTMGPWLQQLLHNAFYGAVEAAGIPPAVIASAARDLAFAAGMHQCEVQTTEWNAAVYREIGSGIAGRQYAGYLRILWHDTKLAALAAPLGVALGEVAHIAEDVRSGDRRFWSIAPAERVALVEWAVATLSSARTHGLRFVEVLAASLAPNPGHARRCRVSAALVFDEALRAVDALGVPELAQEDVLAVLSAALPGPLEIFYEAGCDAELPSETLLRRAAALFLSFCAGKLADDLVDGTCHYLPKPMRRGPGMQYLLHNAFAATLLETGVTPSVLRVALGELALSAAHHQSAIRVAPWSAATYRSLVEGSAARQYVGYLALLWCGTTLAARAAEVGPCLAIPTRIVADLRAKDARLFSMTAADRTKIVEWGREQLARAAALDLRFAHAAIAPLSSALASEDGR